MERRTILAVVLALTTFLMWDAWMNYRYPDRYADPAADVVAEALPEDVAPPAPVVVAPAPVPTDARLEQPVVAAREVPFEGCDVRATWSTPGGFLRDAVLTEHSAPFAVEPIWTFLWSRVTGVGRGPWKPYGDEPGLETLLTRDAMVFGMGAGDWRAASVPSDVLAPSADGTVVVRGTSGDGLEVTRFLRPVPGETCTFDLTTTWRNVGPQPFSGDLWVQIHDVIPEDPGRYESVVQPYAMVDGDYEWLRLKKLIEDEPFTGKVDWLALADRYFALVVLPQGESDGRVAFTRLAREGGEDAFGLHYTVRADLAPGGSHTEQFSVYIGPKELDTLRSLHPSLVKLVDLGFFSFFGKILLSALRFFYTLVGQWGVAIILLTVSVKALFYPLTQASFKSSQAMSALQPELQAIREGFKDKPEELNRRTMELFRERGVNPLGGCLPMLVQFPVWIALYQVLLSSVELYHTEFLYLKDLSSVDPYGALPAVVVVLMVVQQQFMPTGNMDPAQARLMKWMPLLFGFFFFAFPSGLVVYIFVNMVLTILQQWVIKRTWRQPEPVAAATT